MNYKKSTVLAAGLLSIAVIVTTFQSCVKDFDMKKLVKTAWNPNIAVPLVYSSLTIQDILTKHDTQGIIQVGADNFCTLVYNGNLFSITASEFIKIPLQSPPPYSATLSPAQIAVLNAAGTVTASYSQAVNFVTYTPPALPASGPNIDSIVFKTGSIDVLLNSDFRFNGQILIKIPSAKKNGVVFSKILPIIYTGTVPVIASGNYDISEYTFDMSNGGSTTNQFLVNYDVTITGTGAAPSTSDKVSIAQTFSNINFRKIFGDIKQQSLSPDKDTVELSIFKNALGMGTFTLVEPSVIVTISNSYGVPIYANISQLEGYNPGTGTFPITGSPSPLPINSPNFSQIGQTLSGDFTLDKTNSNIVSVINNIPKYLIYKINSQTNIGGGTTNSNFVLDTSRFKVDMEIKLPLWGTAKDFFIMDTVDFDISDGNIDGVESILFRTFNSNGFPIDVDMQIYFADSLYTKLDSLVTPNQLILKSGVINPVSGKVSSPTQSVYDAVLTKTRLDHLKTAKYMLVRALASSTNAGNTNIKIYSDYRLDIKLGMQAQFHQSF